jgi:hypothetical protein
VSHSNSRQAGGPEINPWRPGIRNLLRVIDPQSGAGKLIEAVNRLIDLGGGGGGFVGVSGGKEAGDGGGKFLGELAEFFEVTFFDALEDVGLQIALTCETGGHGGGQFGGGEGFQEVIVRAGGHAATKIVRAHGAGHENKRNGGGAGTFADGFEGAITVQAGHFNVADDEVGFLVDDLLDAFAAIPRLADGISGMSQGGGNCRTHFAAVVYHQNVFHKTMFTRRTAYQEPCQAAWR